MATLVPDAASSCRVGDWPVRGRGWLDLILALPRSYEEAASVLCSSSQLSASWVLCCQVWNWSICAERFTAKTRSYVSTARLNVRVRDCECVCMCVFISLLQTSSSVRQVFSNFVVVYFPSVAWLADRRSGCDDAADSMPTWPCLGSGWSLRGWNDSRHPDPAAVAVLKWSLTSVFARVWGG